jgi:hypothetical protein
MVTETDGLGTLEFADHYVIQPTMPLWTVDDYCSAHDCRPCPAGFRYSSGENDRWLTVEEIRHLISAHVDRHFAIRSRRAA